MAHDKESGILARHRVPLDPGGCVDLGAIDPSSTAELGRDAKDRAHKKLRKDQERLEELQVRLFAENKRSLLIVLQAMDTGGKDGTIRSVLGPLNAQGVRVQNFKKPTEEEAAHHFLWRIRKALPAKGMIGVFNRSHYEDILVPTVYGTLPADKVAGRYEEINEFERGLAAEGATVVKFFLHISKEEQKRRLQDRLDDPEKRWKFNPADLKTRERWPAFMKSYGKILSRTSTVWAPWHIIPADKKWYRDFLVGRILRRVLDGMRPRFPKAPKGLEDIPIPD